MTKLKDLRTPVFQAEPIPPYKAEEYRLGVSGLVREEQNFTLQEIKEMEFSRINARLTSVSGWSVRVDWDGVSWQDFLKNIELHHEATYVTFTSLGGYDTTVSLKDLENPRVMLAYGVAGEPLEKEYGAPLRMLIPNLWGYKSCKQLTNVEFSDKMIGGFWEDRGYTLSGEIEPGITFDVNTQQYREILGGEVIDF